MLQPRLSIKLRELSVNYLKSELFSLYLHQVLISATTLMICFVLSTRLQVVSSKSYACTKRQIESSYWLS